MNQHDVVDLVGTITGYWPATDQRAKAMVRWLNERGVTVADARAALAALAEQYDGMPSIKQLGTKLAELGTQTKRTLGVGDRVVIEGMKARILPRSREAATREGVTIRNRLTRERDAAAEYQRDAVKIEDDESVGFFADLLVAFDELLTAEGGRA